MHEIWHIFQKDVRYLRYEIAFLVALNALFFWTSTRGVQSVDISDAIEPLFAAAAAYTIARLIHSEALPGENQFWVTRPYHWPNLLAAKLLFVVVFVNVPLLLAQTAIVIKTGFPFASTVPGLLWTQVLVAVCVALPLLVLAAVTVGLVPFIGVLLGIGLASLCISYFGLWLRLVLITAPVGTEWLRDSVVFLAIFAMAPLVLYWQYRFRRTQFSRSWMLSVVLFGTSLFMFLPGHTLFPLQSWLSKQKFPVLTVAMDPARKFKLVPARGGGQELILPIRITGLPEGARTETDHVDMHLETAENQPVMVTSSVVGRDSSGQVLRGYLSPGRPNAPATGTKLKLRASFYLTVFGNARDRTLTLSRVPQDVMDGVQCYAGFLNQLECRAPFRWPARLVWQKSSSGAKSLITGLISYSPFPASLQINPIIRKGAVYYSPDPLPADRPVTMEVEEPLAWVRRDLEVTLPEK